MTDTSFNREGRKVSYLISGFTTNRDEVRGLTGWTIAPRFIVDEIVSFGDAKVPGFLLHQCNVPAYGRRIFRSRFVTRWGIGRQLRTAASVFSEGDHSSTGPHIENQVCQLLSCGIAGLERDGF